MANEISAVRSNMSDEYCIDTTTFTTLRRKQTLSSTIDGKLLFYNYLIKYKNYSLFYTTIYLYAAQNIRRVSLPLFLMLHCLFWRAIIDDMMGPTLLPCLFHAEAENALETPDLTGRTSSAVTLS